MVRLAEQRISRLFLLARAEACEHPAGLADRYVRLARRIGMRYNVRLSSEFAELFCRGCSAYWVEGRTVRTRLRSGVRLRTCLVCGRERRTRYPIGKVRRSPAGSRPDPAPPTVGGTSGSAATRAPRRDDG